MLFALNGNVERGPLVTRGNQSINLSFFEVASQFMKGFWIETYLFDILIPLSIRLFCPQFADGETGRENLSNTLN